MKCVNRQYKFLIHFLTKTYRTHVNVVFGTFVCNEKQNDQLRSTSDEMGLDDSLIVRTYSRQEL